jgi:mono/diheme cytochrome c family protein
MGRATTPSEAHMDIRTTITGSVVIAVLIGASLGIAESAKHSAQGAATGRPASMSRVERGRYLATLMGCGDCHTPGTFYGSPDFKRALSGSELGWKGPWGVSYPRNLTPDAQTGIGSWSEQQIVAALRTGMRPDGTVLQPPMPWPNYAQLTDDDAYALAAYLKSLPAVAHKVPDKLAPGQSASGAYFELPAPPQWDAPRTDSGSAAPGEDSH